MALYSVTAVLKIEEITESFSYSWFPFPSWKWFSEWELAAKIGFFIPILPILLIDAYISLSLLAIIYGFLFLIIICVPFLNLYCFVSTVVNTFDGEYDEWYQYLGHWLLGLFSLGMFIYTIISAILLYN